MFYDMADVMSNKSALERVINEWVELADKYAVLQLRSIDVTAAQLARVPA